MADRIERRKERRHLMVRGGMVLLFALALGSVATGPDLAAAANLNHTSTNLSSTKWPQGWGIAGGKYGAFDCPTCHIPDTSNIKWIRPTITVLGNFSSTGTNTVTVVFRNVTSFGHDNRSPNTSSVNICEVCHSRNKHHNYNATRNATFGGDLTHNNGADCTAACHTHDTGFKPSGGDCLGCHNATQNAGISGYTRRQVVTNGGVGGDFIKLSRHVSNGTANQIVTKWDCTVCHMEGSTTDANTTAYHHGTSDPTGLINLRNVDNPTTGWAINNRSMNEQMRTDMDTFCVTCHDSNGAAGINVNATNSGLNLTSARALTPFNSADNLKDGHDSITTAQRTRVTDVKTQFYAGTYTWNGSSSALPSGFTASNYNGNPSQHAVLGPRYYGNFASWTATAWTTHVNRAGQTMNVIREKARLHCSDCHLTEANAHGAQNSWWMLLNGVPGDFTNEPSQTGIAYNSTGSICLKCHATNIYAPSANETAVSRFNHNTDNGSTHTQANWGTSWLGPNCTLCHGGNNAVGTIHGSNSSTETYTTGGTNNITLTRYRFLPGTWMRPQAGGGTSDSTAWTGTATESCYWGGASVGGAETMSSCGHHSGTTSSSGSAPPYGRTYMY